MGDKPIRRADQSDTVAREAFHAEKEDLLRTELSVSAYVTADDSGARHQGKNGFVTHMGNGLFGWLQSTDSKVELTFWNYSERGKRITL